MPTDPLSYLLVGLILVPLYGAVAAALVGSREGNSARWIALHTSLITLALAVIVAWNFSATRLKSEPSDPAKTFEPRMSVAFNILPLETHTADPKKDPTPRPPSAIRFFIGLDGLNVWLIVLTALLVVSSVFCSWTAINERVNEFYAWLLLLEMGMLGVFLAFDIILFYVFFELTLVPLFFLIGIWGRPHRQTAAKTFFVYTLVGSLITLLGVLGVVLAHYLKGGVLTFSIPDLVELTRKAMSAPAGSETLMFWRNVQFWVFGAMMVGFAVKVPLVPVHTWLPLAHTEAPTAGSVLLAGALLKIGAYGFLRLCIPLAPDATIAFGAPLIAVLAVIGIIYGAFCALQQDDVKKLVAYSSVSHLGFCMLGLFALTEAGLAGGVLQMINHGLSTGALFLLIGMLYERYHTRKLGDYGGMAAKLKLVGFFMVFIAMSSVGLPGLNGFIGEVLCLLGMYGSTAVKYSRVLAILGTLGVVLGAWYMLSMIRHVFFGELKEPPHDGHEPVGDMTGRELAALVPIAVLCLVIGLYPQPMIDTVKPELRTVAEIAQEAKKREDVRAAKSDSQAAVAPEGLR